MRLIVILLLAPFFALAGALPMQAQDGIPSQGWLSDRDYYQLIACGAEPGGDCQIPLVRWPSRSVSVALLPPERGFPADLLTRLDRDLDNAIAQINAARSGLRLVRDDGLRKRAAIVVTPSALREGDRTRRIPRMPDGEEIGVGFMWLWWDDRNAITQASILIAQDITPHDLRSVILEELFQCLGFLYDIENPYYDGRSIVAQDSNETTTIRGQDRKALLRHYPPN